MDINSPGKKNSNNIKNNNNKTKNIVLGMKITKIIFRINSQLEGTFAWHYEQSRHWSFCSLMNNRWNYKPAHTQTLSLTEALTYNLRI